MSARSLIAAITGDLEPEIAISIRGRVQPLSPGAFSLLIEVIAALIASSLIRGPGLGLVLLKGSWGPIGCLL
jgi:hypothetical protein